MELLTTYYLGNLGKVIHILMRLYKEYRKICGYEKKCQSIVLSNTVLLKTTNFVTANCEFSSSSHSSVPIIYQKVYFNYISKIYHKFFNIYLFKRIIFTVIPSRPPKCLNHNTAILLYVNFFISILNSFKYLHT